MQHAMHREAARLPAGQNHRKEQIVHRKPCHLRSVQAFVAAAATGVAMLCAGGTAAASMPAGYQMRVFAAGGPSLSSPDDITRLGGWIYVVYQNATQPDGSTGGASNVVAYRRNGTVARTWSVTGHADGLTADPTNHRVIVTVNEDANSSLYTIDPSGPAAQQVQHYTYSPDPATLTGGGTDAISIVNGKIFISASNPSPTVMNGTTFSAPAVFTATIPATGLFVTLTPAFNDNSAAVDAVSGAPVTLNLADPDSNAAVPSSSPRFAGDFMLDSQGDSDLVFAGNPGTPSQSLTSLMLTSTSGAPQVDDVTWTTTPHGTLLMVDAKLNQIDAITGPLGLGTAFTAVPSGTTPLSSDLGTIDLNSGAVTPVLTGLGSPKGLLYVPGLLPHGGKGHGKGSHGKSGKHGKSGTHGKSSKSGSGHGNGHGK